MRMSESVKEITVALIAAQKEIVPVKRDKTNPFFKSSYVGLDTVLPEALRILNGHDLALIQTVGGAEGGGTTLSTTILHSSGEWISDTQPLLLSKEDPQGQGSAITYARRYGLMSALGIVAEDDDDANRTVAAPPARTAPRKAAPKRADAAPPVDAYERKARELEAGERKAAAPKAARDIERSTEPQHKLIRSLVGKMFDGDERAQVSCIAVINAHAVNDAATEIHLTPLSKGEASAMIDELQKMQQAEPQPKLEPVGADPARDA